MSPSADDDVLVDARGLRCPLPVIRLAERARTLAAGTTVTVLATDPATRYDIPAWARMRGHGPAHVTERTEDDGSTVLVLVVELRA